MATKKDAVVEEKPARKPRSQKPKSLKIERKRKTTATAKAPRQKAATIKAAKLDRVLRKARTLVRRSLKNALKGLGLKRVPDKVYKKIDSAVAKSPELTAAIESAVVEVVNSLPAVKKNSGQEPAIEKKSRAPRTKKEPEPEVKKARKPRTPKAKKEEAATTEKKNGNGEKKNGNGKKEAPAAQE